MMEDFITAQCYQMKQEKIKSRGVKDDLKIDNQFSFSTHPMHSPEAANIREPSVSNSSRTVQVLDQVTKQVEEQQQTFDSLQDIFKRRHSSDANVK